MPQRKSAKSANTTKADAQLEMFANTDCGSRPSQQKAYMDSIGANAPSEDCRPADIDDVPSMQVEPPATADARVLGQPNGSDASATPSGTGFGGGETVVNNSKKEEAVVNDCKGEVQSVTGGENIEQLREQATSRSRSSGLLAMRNKEKPHCFSPKEKKLTLSEFHALRHREHTPKGDQPALRDAARLMEASCLSPAQFAVLGENDLEKLIQKHLAQLPVGTKQPASMCSPRKLARAMLYAMARMFSDVAEVPAIAPPVRKQVKPEPEGSRPKAIASQVSAWNPNILGEARTSASGDPITPERKKAIEIQFWKYITLCRRAGMPLDDQTTLVRVTSVDAFETVLPEIKAAYGAGTIPTFLSSIKQLLEGLLTATHANTLAWAADVTAFGVGQELPLERIEELRDLTSVAENFTVWEIPDRIADRARRAGPRAIDRDCLLACAFATALALDVLSVSPEGLGHINLETDIVGVGADRALRHQQSDSCQDFLLSEATLALLDELAAWREANRLTTPWLFPDRRGKNAKAVTSTITYLTTAIEAALLKRFTTVDLQDAVAINAIDMGQIDAYELSDARAAAHVKSTRARYKLVFENPLTGR